MRKSNMPIIIAEDVEYLQDFVGWLDGMISETEVTCITPANESGLFGAGEDLVDHDILDRAKAIVRRLKTARDLIRTATEFDNDAEKGR